MKSTIAPALVLLPALALAGDSSLFAITISSSSTALPAFSVTFKELEQAGAGSLVEMSYDPPRRVPDQGHLLQGLCLMMKHRSEGYVAAASVPGNPLQFTVTFPTPERPRVKGRESWPLSRKDCAQWVAM